MKLIDLWIKSQDEIRSKHLHQIITFAGDGRLRDVGSASLEFRDFLAHIPSDLLNHYASECLGESFTDSGFALQDIVNQVGRRLGLDVTDGRYRGSVAHIGYDGLWRLPNKHSIVVEVKTTDAFRIPLDTLAGYREALVGAEAVAKGASSMLIVVGRQDTGDLEAQIRGSKHAWDIRLISVESLIKLMLVKEGLEDPTTIKRVHQILLPREFTRLDDLVDMLFSAAEDLKPDEETVPIGRAGDDNAHEKKFTPVAFHQASVERIAAHLQESYVKHSRATFATADGDSRLVCAVSREHLRAGQPFFWFAFHPHQRDFLAGATSAFLAFGCGSPDNLLLIPFSDFVEWLDGLNVTDTGERTYWHVHITQQGHSFRLLRRAGFAAIDLSKYFVP